MKWIIFSGTAAITNEQMEKDVRDAVRRVLEDGNSIITGGAAGVDFFCMDEVFKLNKLDRLMVIIPNKLDYYIENYYDSFPTGMIRKEKAEQLIELLKKIYEKSPKTIVEMPFTKLTDFEFYERDSEEVRLGDELYAFHADHSLGTRDTIDKAVKKGIPVKIHKDYII